MKENPYCFYCNSKLSEQNATVDHVHPKSKGGHRTEDNTVLACKPCNLLKGGKTVANLEQLIEILKIVKSFKSRKEIVHRCEEKLL